MQKTIINTAITMKIFPSSFPAKRLNNKKYKSELDFYNELSKEYIEVDTAQVFYSPVFSERNERRDIDFVIVDEARGVIFIELKGGALVRGGSVWRRNGDCADTEIDRQINFQKAISTRLFNDVRFDGRRGDIPFYNLLAIPDAILQFERNVIHGFDGIIDYSAIESGIRQYIQSVIPVRERDGYVNPITKGEFEQMWFKLATAVLQNEDLDAGAELEEIIGVPLDEIESSVGSDAPPQNHGKPWTMQEERYLYDLFVSDADLHDIAEAMERQVGGIKARLRRLGLIDRHGDRIEPIPEFKSYSRRP
ncbi:hypothetical protein H2509_00605 [Stappia sp. F7233]|uniref:NERD domain-containing protein n=1 Tax=Stappia albiluteola TaxID=2758565 RepID=A0A839AA21_9HYPH|nr:hypothetical protein [Stappia albiluteola]MBA5775619.1 hypothetical protein [Stappia albiluteola]